ncbi:YbaY family lipoprotein [Pseudomonas aeruginosa]
MKKLPLLLAASILAGCGTQQSTSNASFDGEVFYRERIALPPSARLSVSLEDVSLADAPSVQLASQTREITSQVPLAFHLEHDPKQVKPGHSYAVSARIELNGQLLFINTTRHSVKLDGSDPQPYRVQVESAR